MLTLFLRFSVEAIIRMMKRKLLGDRAGLADKMLRMSPPWQLRVATAATLIALGAYSPTDVHALGLGRITVLSALGEPLRAEIDIPQITADEAASLKTSVAPPSAFRAAGVEYNQALANLQFSLQQRADGRPYLRLSSDRAVSEPFVDLILEANWSSGRIVRDYTLLFDPPGMRQAAPAAPVSAQVPDTPLPATAPAPQPATAQRSARPSQVAPAPVPAANRRAPVAAPAQAAAPSPAGKQIKVQSGDTAGKIAATYKPSEVSLDQMLVALLRANPDAFINGNVNRIKAGALLELPSAEQASSMTPGEARQTLSVQSANFNDFRRKLAEAVPATQVAPADRQASGSLQTRVEEKKPAAASPDKLTLSKGTVKGKAPEAQIAESRQAKEATQRVAELSKNIQDLARLQAPSAPAGAGAGAAAPAASGARSLSLPVGTAASAAKPASAPIATASAPAAPASAKATSPAATAVATNAAASAVSPASATQAASASVASVSPSAAASTSVPESTTTVAAPPVTAAPALPASKPKSPVAAKPAAAEPSLVDELLENPAIPAAAGGLIALLAGFGFYRSRQRKKSAQVDSSFLDSRLQPDSFFGSSGGQHVDTNDEAPAGSSLVYSPSQLDAAGDVDPVAEADVYLAYGRDLQAEEILKEALRVNPSRIAIHGKLLEIYAKRRDVRAFEVVAAEAHNLSGGEGSEWDRICELGRELDGENALYQPGGHPKSNAEPATAVEPASPVFGASTLPAPSQPEFASSSPVPIDLDFGALDDTSAHPPTASHDTGSAAAMAAAPDDDNGLTWDAISSPVQPDVAQADMEPLIDITAPDLPLDHDPAARTTPSTDSRDNHAADAGMIEFDLGSLSLDLDQSVPQAEATAELPQDGSSDTDPMATKLALAQEFHAIGDADGARTLVEEVVAGTTGPLKAKAQRFLAELG